MGGQDEQLKIPQLLIHQLTGINTLQRMQHITRYFRIISGQLSNQLFNLLAFEIFLRTTQVTGNNRKLLFISILLNILFLTIDQWANHNLLL